MHLLPVSGDCYWRRRGNRENIRLVDWIANLTRRNIAVVHRSTTDFGPQLISTWCKCRYFCSYRARVSQFVLCSLSTKLFARALKPVSPLPRRFFDTHHVHRGNYQRRINEYACRHENLIFSIGRNTYLLACVRSTGSFSTCCIYLCCSILPIFPLSSLVR